MSTAFVCGRRSGIVRENELDLGQEFHNSYERLKLEAELIFTQACRQLGIELRIFRPTIVIGSSANTTGALPSNLFFAFLRLLMATSRRPGALNTIVRLKSHPWARFNIVPVEYVTTAVDRLTDSPQAAGKTFHIAVPNPPTQQIMLQLISDCLRLPNLRLFGPDENLSNPSPLELRLATLMLPYREYLEQDVQFDCREAHRLLKDQNVEPPVIDSRQVERLMALAQG
jgi:thioester reductase-like protein